MDGKTCVWPQIWPCASMWGSKCDDDEGKGERCEASVCVFR